MYVSPNGQKQPPYDQKIYYKLINTRTIQYECNVVPMIIKFVNCYKGRN